jgi:hypothetical protein
MRKYQANVSQPVIITDFSFVFSFFLFSKREHEPATIQVAITSSVTVFDMDEL